MFESIEINMRPCHIYVKTNDNAITIQGAGPDGFIDRSFMKDDPKAAQKVKDLLNEIKAYQTQQMEEAKSNLDDQFPGLLTKVEAMFEEENTNEE